MHLRNKMFDKGILPSETFDVPVISVGNISTGGTGKTPHIEYLSEMLHDNYNVAVLSRGYKRKTSGYLEANSKSKVSDIGDEPLQFYRKYGNNIVVAVDEKRRRGIKNILKNYPDTHVVLLDDAFQHRYVKPALSILLTEYFKLFTKNFVLPTGSLRECCSGVNRADVIIITKTPAVFSPIDKDLMLEELKKFEHKPILFSYINYGQLQPVNQACNDRCPRKIKTIFLLTGIANTTSLEEYMKRISKELFLFKYPDHHKYTKKDIKKVAARVKEIFSGDKAIVTTEKDLMRLKDPKLLDVLKDIPLYYIPIKVKFHEQGESEFENMVINAINNKLEKIKKSGKHNRKVIIK